MKTITKHLPFSIFLLILVWKSSSLVQAQSDTTYTDTTYTGDITVTTQAQVDALRTTLAGKTRIDGNLTIGDYYRTRIDITDLSPLRNLTRITGDITIQQNEQLVNLNALNSLQAIGGWFYVTNNDQLTTLGDFPDLQTIGGDFWAYNNEKLTTLGNFTSLQSIGGYFRVNHNTKLLSLGSFPNLTSVGMDNNIYINSLRERRDSVSIVVEKNPDLVLCSWLEEFLPTGSNAVTGDIYIQDNATGCETTEEINNRLPVLSVKNRIFVHKDSTTTSFNVYANVRWQLVTSDDATWITSVSSDSSTHSSRITGENEATITLMHTRAPNETQRSTILMLTAIDEEGEELTNPATITINLTQLTLYEGDITLSSQEEVDEFVSNTTVIDGNLTIGYTDYHRDRGSPRSNITDLTPLSNMTHIMGDLIIQQNEQLVNLTRLNNLQSIGGIFSVRYNDTLTTLGDFPILQTIGEFFLVNDNNRLTTLGDFPNLQTIGGNFEVGGRYGNNKLTTLGDFPALQTIGGSFSVGDYGVNNKGNDKLTTLGDFSNLQTIGGSFSVSDNDTLTTLGDFPNLQTIGGTFVVGGRYGNDKLTTLGDFPVLQTIGGAFRMSHNDELTTLGDFPNLQTIGGNFEVGGHYGHGRYGNDKLTTLGDFPALQTIGGWFYVTNNDKLTTLGDFSILQTIGKFFLVDDNHRLTTLGDFPNLQTIGGNFEVGGHYGYGRYGNDKLTTLGDFPNLDSIGGSFYVINNDTLTTLGDFTNLQSIGGNFEVGGNYQLTTLGDFPNLDSIGGVFWVNGNYTLTTLGNFSALMSIGIGRISVPFLDFEHRDNVSIVVENNPGLSNCCVLARFLNQGNNRVEGNTYITNNAAGCDENTIQNTCRLIVTTNKNHQIAYDNIDPISISFTVRGGAMGWTSEITYTPANANFIALSPAENSAQTGAITITATPVVNTSVERTATITLTTIGIGTPSTQMIVITQGEENTPNINIPNINIPNTDTSNTNTNTPNTNTPNTPDTLNTPNTLNTPLSTHTKESIFTLYPNPTNGTLTIEGVMGYLQMYIHDLVGREVMTYSLISSKKTIDVSDLPSGMYVVTLRGEDKTWTEVLIIDN